MVNVGNEWVNKYIYTDTYKYVLTDIYKFNKWVIDELENK